MYIYPKFNLNLMYVTRISREAQFGPSHNSYHIGSRIVLSPALMLITYEYTLCFVGLLYIACCYGAFLYWKTLL